MARTPTTTAAAPEATGPAPIVIGEFTFEVGLVDTIPEDVKAPAPRERLPFYNVFGALPVNGYVFVPDSFWFAPKEKGGRGYAVPEKGIDAQVLRTRLNECFKGWRKDHPDQPFAPVFRRRKAGTDNGKGGTFAEDGWTFFKAEGPSWNEQQAAKKATEEKAA